MKIIRKYIGFLVLVLPLLSFSQKVSNIHFEQAGKQIYIYYDLQGNQKYAVQVFCSTDDGKSWGNQLKYVTGEVGENQKTGNSKMIVWDVLAEREQLSGEIRFKIEAEQMKGTFTDTRDGQTYKWVRIGVQVWMAENLNYKTYSVSWCYDNDPTNCDIYGRLYDWNTSITVCPSGWHLPDRDEWSELDGYLGRGEVTGKKIKEAGTKHWPSPNSEATNESGFTALPSGYRGYHAALGVLDYYLLGKWGQWWSATEDDSLDAWYFFLANFYFNGMLDRKGTGISVRCVRD